MRWRIKLNEYDYNIVYKPGKVNSNADALSRNPPDFTNINEIPSSSISNTSSNCTTTDCTDTPSFKRLQGVVVGADDVPLVDSGRVEDTDCNRVWENNERIIATIFLAHGREINGRPEVLVGIDHSDDGSNVTLTLTLRQG